jgi:hypothetical protein
MIQFDVLGLEFLINWKNFEFFQTAKTSVLLVQLQVIKIIWSNNLAWLDGIDGKICFESKNYFKKFDILNLGKQFS